MNDYIKREDALNMDFRISVRPFESRVKTAERAVQAYANEISKIPAADVVERKSGEWIDMGDFEQCSVCTGTRLKEMQTVYGKAIWIKTPYCPNCGADMRQIMEYPQVPGITPTVI